MNKFLNSLKVDGNYYRGATSSSDNKNDDLKELNQEHADLL
ncbi:MAG TPA: hypothetical protein VE593_09345 [Nitrososphaeraceae archaeon]|nr:hypothetical protein [Nitrososphaeraceae archaeon]